MGPRESAFPNGISIGSTAFAGFIGMPNTRTDKQTTESATCVAIGRICVIHAMRSNNITADNEMKR